MEGRTIATWLAIGILGSIGIWVGTRVLFALGSKRNPAYPTSRFVRLYIGGVALLCGAALLGASILVGLSPMICK